MGVQVYESKLQELQKQVETRSLVAETPDEEELEEEEEEEGASSNSSVLRIQISILHHININMHCLFSPTISGQSLNSLDVRIVSSVS